MADQALRIPKFLGKNPDMMDLIKKWRIGASKYGLASLQLYLLFGGIQGDHVALALRR